MMSRVKWQRAIDKYKWGYDYIKGKIRGGGGRSSGEIGASTLKCKMGRVRLSALN